ncbi:MAG TPA: GNAT family N-acetyltransferase [Ferrovibrio sp.]|uniref:GNAT family N-acetyltransferase n=1 Tax=Ferrovibrio sp. TaxID=1917215 RepID=UPI002ED2F64A
MRRIRLATPADIPALPGIEQSAGEAFRATAHAWVADEPNLAAEAYPPLIAAGRVWVAETDGGLAGFLHAWPAADGDFHIWELAVRLPWQRRGFGRALIDTARRQALAQGCTALTLTTFRDVAFNAPYYKGLGFAILTDPPPRLAAILAAEAARGLTSRCAMRAALS